MCLTTSLYNSTIEFSSNAASTGNKRFLFFNNFIIVIVYDIVLIKVDGFRSNYVIAST